jgi:hypothetical protein
MSWMWTRSRARLVQTQRTAGSTDERVLALGSEPLGLAPPPPPSTSTPTIPTASTSPLQASAAHSHRLARQPARADLPIRRPLDGAVTLRDCAGSRPSPGDPLNTVADTANTTNPGKPDIAVAVLRARSTGGLHFCVLERDGSVRPQAQLRAQAEDCPTAAHHAQKRKAS